MLLYQVCARTLARTCEKREENLRHLRANKFAKSNTLRVWQNHSDQNTNVLKITLLTIKTLKSWKKKT